MSSDAAAIQTACRPKTGDANLQKSTGVMDSVTQAFQQCAYEGQVANSALLGSGNVAKVSEAQQQKVLDEGVKKPPYSAAALAAAKPGQDGISEEAKHKATENVVASVESGKGLNHVHNDQQPAEKKKAA